MKLNIIIDCHYFISDENDYLDRERLAACIEQLASEIDAKSRPDCGKVINQDNLNVGRWHIETDALDDICGFLS